MMFRVAAFGLLVVLGLGNYQQAQAATPQLIESIDGGWFISKNTDKITDDVTYVLQHPDLQNSNYLGMACAAAEDPTLAFYFNDYLGEPAEARVFIYRIDNNKPVETMMAYDPQVVRDPSQYDSAKITREMASGRNLTIRAFDSEGATHDAEFELRGAGIALSRFYEICRSH